MTYSDVYERLIAETYDAVYSVVRDPSGDAAFYLSLAREAGGPVLELGCGTGRTLLPIAREGIACVGLDSSGAMLDVLRRKAPPPNLAIVEGSMEALDLGEGRFRLVTAPFRALSHLLDVRAQLECLGRVLRHLAPGGTFAFDLFDPKLARTAIVDEPETVGTEFEMSGVRMRRRETIRRDLTRQVLTVRFRFEGGPPELSGITEVSMRWYYRYEIEHLLARVGFTDVAFYGDYARGPWRAEGETVVVARAPGC